MKTIQEKAKAYDEVRKKIAIRFGSNVADEIFSEYEESEDERIRKDLIAMVRLSCTNGDDVDKKIAWLEKQGEYANFRNKIQIGDKVTRNEDGVLVNLSQLNRVAKKQGEQILDNSAKTCKDEQKPIKEHDACDFCEERYGCVNPCPTKLIEEEKPVDFSDLRTWKYIVDAVWTEKEGIGQYLDSPFTEEVAKKLQKRFGKIEQKPAETEKGVKGNNREIPNSEQKPADKVDQYSLPVSDNSSLPTFDESIYHPCTEEVHEQKPAEWSEEDELHFRELESLVKRVWAIAEHENDKETIHKMSDLSFFLKTLKPQPKQEWSEEDNAMLISIENILIGRGHSFHDKEINWIKSLRHRKLCSYNPYKAVVESIAEMCKHYDKATDLQDFYDNVKVKCKDAKEYDSLFPSQWKPSEEQMKALEEAVHGKVPESNALWYLYRDLRKLIC